MTKRKLKKDPESMFWEVIEDDSTIPEHRIPWQYDFDNSYQRIITPNHSVIHGMLAITNKYYNHLQEGKDCPDCLRNKCSDPTHNVY